MIGWMFYLYQQLDIDNLDKANDPSKAKMKTIFGAIAIALIILALIYGKFHHHRHRIIQSSKSNFISVQQMPLSSGIFLILPVICWTPVRTFNMLRQMVRIQTWFWLAGIEVLVLSFFHRFFLTGLLIALLAYEYIILKEKKEKLQAFFHWALNCLVLSIFPSLPLVDKDSNNFTLL